MWIFDQMRWDHADWYTDNPQASMSEDQLQDLAQQCGMTVDELRAAMTTPSVEATCPLCGLPQTHLSNCKGCGDAWGYEFEEMHGQDAANQLRRRVKEALTSSETFTQEQVDRAVGHAYGFGGCMVCAECWRNIVAQPDAHQVCPLVLVHERQSGHARLPHGLLLTLLANQDATVEEQQEMARGWLNDVAVRWLEVWNTMPDGPGRVAVTEWREKLLLASFGDLGG